MKAPSLRHLFLAALASVLASPVPADEHVAVAAFAKTEYTRRKYENGKPRLETYVFMQGKYVEGRTVDHSIERMTFRQLVERLAPDLARQQYLPATDLKAADLLLVVHWGATASLETSAPPASIASIPTHDEILRDRAIAEAADPVPHSEAIDGMSGRNVSESEPYRDIGFQQLDQSAEAIANDLRSANKTQLLGYDRDLARMQNSPFQSTTEATLRSDLASERYFIIIKAYDLKDAQPAGGVRRPVWTIHLNIRGPGQDFATALARMGNVAVDFFGRSTDAVTTAVPRQRTGTVTLGEMTILGEVPDPPKAK